MQTSDGSFATEINAICDSWVAFYSSLFSIEAIDRSVQNELLNSLSETLSPSQSSLCEGLLSLEEVHLALVGLAHGKSPGSDGLPVEFYLKFWNILGSDLVDVFNASFVSGRLPSSQREALISLIFKKGDRFLHKNWRPISLLNCDYKICARALAGRLLRVLQYVIHPDQTCGVKGRFIGENVSLLRDVVELSKESGLPLAILSLDQEKAFDRVDWDCLFATLQRMGFGSSFISWVRLLYTDIRSAVLVNGYTSRFFKPSRGVRQGCPLSPLLYVISIEVLAVNLRAHPCIRGLRLPHVSSCLPALSLYADDTSVISSSDVATKAVFEVYDKFERGTGAKLNLDKCKGLWLGGWINRLDRPVLIQWTSEKIKVLGVYLGNSNMDEFNWKPRVESVARCLDSWRTRQLSLSGRALVANALALSKIWYVASVLPMPASVLSELNSILFSFFWGGRRDLVKRDVVVLPKALGGFSVVSIRLKVYALLVQWFRRMVTSPSGWVSLLTFWFFDRFGVPPATVLSDPASFVFTSLPAFYVSMLDAWIAVGGSSSPSGFVIASATPSPFVVDSISTKGCYDLLLSLSPCVPHCVAKFTPVYSSLDWDATWSSLFFLPLDRQVCDLNWKVAHGVLYTADRLISFGLDVPSPCFCGSILESPEHLFFACPLACSAIDWVQSLLFSFSSAAPSIELRHLLFGFNKSELRTVPKVFCYLLNVCKFFIWCQRNDFRFRSIQPSAIGLICSIKARLRFYLPIFFGRFSSARRRRFFFKHWGANGVIGVVNDNVFSVII